MIDCEVTLTGAERVGIRELIAVGDAGTVDGETLGTTAVNLFSPDESDVTPGDRTRIVDMGRVPPPGQEAVQPARAEWWWPLTLAALGLLVIEWLLFHRPTRRALRRAIGRRPHPLGGRAQ